MRVPTKTVDSDRVDDVCGAAAAKRPPLWPFASVGAGLPVLAGATLLIHFLCNGRYGYWIDELYFMACGQHLDWGYVDQPPLIAVIARGSRWLFGDSLFAIRFFPALAGAALVWLTGVMARKLGGGRFAALLAAVCVVVAPVYLAFNNLLTMNAFEPLLWTAVAFVVLQIATRNAPRLWLLAGFIAGVGVLNKHSMLFICAALGIGLLLTPERRILRSRWLWLGGLVAFVIILPHLLWQIRWHWPTIELQLNAKRYQFQPVSPLEFVGGQVQLMLPFTVPIWVAGVYFYLRTAAGKPFRFLGWAFVLVWIAGLLSQAKTYYLAPVYPIAFAGGAVAVESWIGRRGWAWLKPVTLALLIMGGAIIAPYVLPILPIEMVPRYLRLLGMKDVRPERRAEGEVPQLLADMLGWEDLVSAVARVYHSLPDADQSHCAIWGGWYGAAGAVDFFGKAYQLPAAVSGHQNYFLWGPGRFSRDVVIAVGIREAWLQRWFDSVELGATVPCPYCMPDRMNTPVYVCRGLKIPVEAFWPKTKCWTCDMPEFAR
ncbi:MAG: glycosyltransferase family 39 protein [Candidatus Binatia bacterium]